MDPILALLIGLGGLVVAIIGLSVSFSVAKRGNKKSTTEEGEEKGVMQASLNYLKHIAEETALDVKDMKRDYGGLCERVAKVEASASSAHKRIDDYMREKE